jgi:hypothetical protein
MTASSRPVADAFAQRPHDAPASARGVLLKYRERARILVRGPITGRAYEFSPQLPAQSVESRDADVLVRSGRFLRA